MKRMLMKAGVLALMIAAAVSAYIYRDVYLSFLPGTIAGLSTEQDSLSASDTRPTPTGTRQDPYIGQGVIQEIQADGREIVIAHREIPGLMGAMTMAFPVSEDVQLDSLAVDDEVEFRIETLQSEEQNGSTIQVFGVSTDTTSTTASATDESQATFTIDSRRQQLIGVRTSPVSYETLNRTIRTIGIVALDETRISEIHSKVDGWIEETFVDFQYQHVQQGDPLFTLYSPELVSTQEEYLLALKGLDLLGTSSIESAALGAEDLVRAARRRLELWDISEAQIQQLEEAGQPTRAMTIYSPASGHVMARDAFPGKHVTPETELYRIADHSLVWVKADVYETDVAWVRQGQRALMRVQALPGRDFSGEVTFLDPHMDEQTRTLTARLEFANPELVLTPGMYADVELQVSMGRRLVVPESAVLPTGERNVVFVDQGDGRMEIRNVRLGSRIDDHYEVLEGLVEGENVVTSGNFLIDAESKLQSAEPVWGGDEAP